MLLFQTSAASAARPAADAIGINLNALYSAGEEIPFVDVFKMASGWTVHTDSGGVLARDADVDTNGWIRNLPAGTYAEASVFKGSSGHYPSGLYTLSYEGKGTLDVSGEGVVVAKTAPGHLTLRVTSATGPGNGIEIRVSKLDPVDPIRNIRLLLPGFAAEPAGNPFNPAFLAVLRPFKVIRFVGWSHADRSETTDWTDARPVTYATQATDVTTVRRMGGVSLEYQIELANLLHADPWFLLPLRASDDYVRRMSSLVKDRLDPALHPYVELANEIWNAAFPEAAYARQMGARLGLDDDPLKAGAKWYTAQAIHVFDVWSGVFGNDANRIVRVLGAAYPLPPLTNVELTYQDAYKHVDAIAIAPYFTPKILSDSAALSRMTVDQLLDSVHAEVTGKFHDFVGYHLVFTKKYGVDLVAYEGGPGLMSPHTPPDSMGQIQKLLRDATNSPRMADIYREALDGWFAMGGKLFNHFDDCSPPSLWGDFGLVEYQSQSPQSSPRFNMLRDYKISFLSHPNGN